MTFTVDECFHWEKDETRGFVVWRCQTNETTVELWPRPHYCDRGKWEAHVDTPGFPQGFPLNPSPFDADDRFPRYYFDINRAKAEMEDLLRERGYTPVDAAAA